MKVWIIFCIDMSAVYSDRSIHAVFDNKEAAEEYKEYLREIETDSFGYSMGEYEVQHAD